MQQLAAALPSIAPVPLAEASASAVAAHSNDLPAAPVAVDDDNASDESEEDLEALDRDDDGAVDCPEEPGVVTFKLGIPAQQWCETRCAQILAMMEYFCEQGFIVYDQIDAGYKMALRLHAEITIAPDEWKYHHMGSAGFWAIVILQLIKYNEWQEWCVRHKDATTLEHCKEAWKMSNLHKLLKYGKGKTFKDKINGGGGYNTGTGDAGRKNGFSIMVTGSKDKRRKFDVRNLGTPQMQRKKMATFAAVMAAARKDPLPKGIANREPPDTFQYKLSNSKREQILLEKHACQESDIQASRDTFMARRAMMMGARAAAAKKPRAPSPIRIDGKLAHESDDDGDEMDVMAGDMTGIGKKKTQRRRPEFDAELDDGDTSYLDDACRAPSPTDVDKALEVEAEKDNLLGDLLGDELTQPAPEPTAPPVSQDTAVVVEEEVPPPAPEPPAEPAESQVEKLKRLQAERRAEQERRDAEELAQLEAAETEANSKKAVPAPSMSSGVGTSKADSDVSSSEDEDDDFSDDGAYYEEDENGEATKRREGQAGPCNQGDRYTDSEMDGSSVNGGEVGEDEDEWESEGDDDFADFLTANKQDAADTEQHERAVEQAAQPSQLTAGMRARLIRVKKAKQKLAIGQQLTQQDQSDLEWYNKIDLEKLRDGEVYVPRKKREQKLEVWMRKKAERNAVADRRRRRDEMRAIKRAEKDEREQLSKEQKEARRLERQKEDEARADRRVKKDQAREKKNWAAIQTGINKWHTKVFNRVEKERTKATRILKNAHKHGHTKAVVWGNQDNGELLLKIAQPQRKPPKKAKKPLPKVTGYGRYFSNNIYAERTGELGVPEGEPEYDPYKPVVQVDVVARPGGRAGTRSHKRAADTAPEEPGVKRPCSA